MAHGIASLVNGFEPVLQRQDFDAACKMFRAVDPAMLPPSLLMELSRAIQLAHDPAGFTVDDARGALELAIRIDPGCLQAWVDLGHFYFSVDSNIPKALKAFREARSRMEALVGDLAAGETKAMEALRRATGE